MHRSCRLTWVDPRRPACLDSPCCCLIGRRAQQFVKPAIGSSSSQTHAAECQNDMVFSSNSTPHVLTQHLTASPTPYLTAPIPQQEKTQSTITPEHECSSTMTYSMFHEGTNRSLNSMISGNTQGDSGLTGPDLHVSSYQRIRIQF